MCVQYFESHHKFVLMVTIRELFRYLVDTSCGDGVSGAIDTHALGRRAAVGAMLGVRYRY